MYLTTTAQKQETIARTAVENPAYRFQNLYSLMHWRPWIEMAAQQVLARPGSSTAGVDRKTRYKFKEKYDHELEKLVASLKDKTYKPNPVRRVYIPKSKGKRRPLGIPSLRDRIVQEALRMMLDPIFESDFQHHSYGFRKGRCTMDAVAVIMPLFNSGVKHYYVIEGDIRSYFDNVHHRKLLSLLKRRIADKDIITLIWKFLKAGVMEGRLFARTESGVPQGGVISPLLANVYLNEFDKWAEERWHLQPYQQQKRRQNGHGNYRMVRYADDVRRRQAAWEDTLWRADTRETCRKAPALSRPGNRLGSVAWQERPKFCNPHQTTAGQASTSPNKFWRVKYLQKPQLVEGDVHGKEIHHRPDPGRKGDIS